MASKANPNNPIGYQFYALADGLRVPLSVNAICDCDAEAGLVALSLTTPSIGVEVQRDGRLVYQAPCRGSWTELVAGRA